jgi:PhnB protein
MLNLELNKMIQLKNFIDFNGNAKEAIELYAKAFKIETPQILLFKDIPDKITVSSENKNRVAHVNLKIAGTQILISDTQVDKPVLVGENITLFIQCDDLQEQKFIYESLVVNAKVIIPLSETFWSKSYAYFIDQFGIGWQLNYDEPEMSK